MTEYEHSMVENFMKHLIINQKIWGYSQVKIQVDMINKIGSEIFINTLTFRIEKIIDAFMSNLQTYLEMDVNCSEQVINAMTSLVTSCLKEKLNTKTLSAFIGYANVYYVRRLNNYPKLILCALKILMEVYLFNKKEMVEVIKHLFIINKNVEAISTVLIILAYFVYHLRHNNKEGNSFQGSFEITSEDQTTDDKHNKVPKEFPVAESREKKKFSERSSEFTDKKMKSRRPTELLTSSIILEQKAKESYKQSITEFCEYDAAFEKYSKNRNTTIDQIMSICIYILLDFDWEVLNEALSSAADLGGNLIKGDSAYEESLLPRLVKSRPNENIGLIALYSLLYYDKSNIEESIMGIYCCKAFIALASNNPSEITEALTINHKDNEVVRPTIHIEVALYSMLDKFTVKARTEMFKQLMTKLPIFKAILNNEKLIQLILLNITDNSEIIKIQVNCLFEGLLVHKSHLWKYVTGSSTRKLTILNECLNRSLNVEFICNAMNIQRCFEFAYMLEDIYELHFHNFTLPQLYIEVLCKLIILLDKADLLYVTTFTSVPTKDEMSILDLEREGGIARLLLKLISICAKIDKSGLPMLRYFIFRNTEDRCILNKIAGIKKDEEVSTKKQQSIITLIFSPPISEENTKEETNTVDKMKKPTLNESLENPTSLFLYIITLMLQLIYFELFGVKTWKNFLKKEADVNNLKNTYENAKKEISETSLYLIKMLTDIIKSDRDNVMLSTKFYKLIEYANMKFDCVDSDKIYSNLDFNCKNLDTQTKSTEDWHNVFTNFAKVWKDFITLLIVLIKKDNTAPIEIIAFLLDVNFVLNLYPILLILTSHDFQRLDKEIFKSASKVRDCAVDGKKVDLELVNKIHSEFSHLYISPEKFKDDQVSAHLESLAMSAYKKLIQEQYSEIGCWYSKKKANYNKILFNYVEKQHGKILAGNLMYTKSEQQYRGMTLIFNEFIKLSMKRDRLGRSLQVKRFDDIETSSTIKHNYAYLRLFILKKMMLRNISTHKNLKGYYNTDFRFKLVKNIFKFTALNSHSVSKANDRLLTESEAKYIPFNVKYYETEMVTVRGTVFGRLCLSSHYLLFIASKRRAGEKYKAGPAKSIQLVDEAAVMKQWKLKAITEGVVKPYNSIRQAIEIYFSNSHSVLFCLFDDKLLSLFVTDLTKALSKGANPQVRIVQTPEKYFSEAKFRERWVKGKLSNFEYLMLLNKYGGRSFNDLNQYPIFPWILVNYEANRKQTPDIPIYSESSMMTSATSMKESFTNEKLFQKLCEKSELSLSEDEKDFSTQFLPELHHPSINTVTGYMMRLEPYASLVTLHKTSNFFYLLSFFNKKILWDQFMSGTILNQELIPELYYLPLIFDNYNFYAFGTSKVGYQLKELYQISLPSWIRNGHIFIQNNSLVLESPSISLKLSKWIDFLFGEKQQSRRLGNQFSSSFEEGSKKLAQTSDVEVQFAEVDQSVAMPIKLFIERHPEISDKYLANKRDYSIFSYGENDKKKLFVTFFLKDFDKNQRIIFIASTDKKVFIINASQKLYKMNEKTNAVSPEKQLVSNEKEISLSISREPFDIPKTTHNGYDFQRCFASIYGNTCIASCKYSDNSWIMTNCLTGNVDMVISFHKSVVNCLCLTASEDKLLSASNDGVVAMWLLKAKSLAKPKWCAAGHDLGIVSIDSCERLGFVATIEASGMVILRNLKNGKFIRVIRCEITYKNAPYTASHVRLSYKGYIVVIAKAENCNDIIVVYSVNGEKICGSKLKGCINCIVLGENGYEFIVGGNSGMLMKYNMLTLEGMSIMKDLDAECKKMPTSDITALCLTVQSKVQLLVGLASGELWTYRSAPKLKSK